MQMEHRTNMKQVELQKFVTHITKFSNSLTEQSGNQTKNMRELNLL